MRLLIAGVLSLSAFAATVGQPDTRLAEAAMKNDKAQVRALLAQHAAVNTELSDGSTALIWASHWNDAGMVEALLRAGASAKAANRYGISALSEASVNGNAQILAKLLDAGADPNTVSQEGETALMTAARTGNLEALKILVEKKADVNVKESARGQTALMWAAAEGHPEAVRYLVAHGADLNAQSRVFDFTALKPKAGSVPMNFPRGGFTPLLFAARQGNLEVARILLDAGANVNLGDPDSTTPLVIAIINYHYDLAGLLLERGADPNIADKKGRTALYAAVDMHTVDVSTRPVPKINEQRNEVDVVKMILAKGGNPNAQLKSFLPPRGVLDGADRVLTDGATPFFRAAKSGDVELMRILLEHGADPKLTPKDGTTPLMAASGIGWRDGKTKGTEAENLAAVKYCIELGLDVNAKNNQDETALHGAAQRGADTIVAYLASKGANLQAKDKKGRTAIDSANGVGAEAGGVRSPHDSTVALLEKLIKESGQTTAKN